MIGPAASVGRVGSKNTSTFFGRFRVGAKHQTLKGEVCGEAYFVLDSGAIGRDGTGR